MSDDPAAEDGSVDRQWERLPASAVADPVVETLPYAECKLQHPDLEPDRYDDSFFPSGLPYELAGTKRVFYWRPALDGSETVTRWQGVCATTRQLRPVGDRARAIADALVARVDDGVELTVDGTIGGDTTVAVVDSYTVPEIEVAELSASSLSLAIGDDRHAFAPGARTRLRLPARTVTPVEGGVRTITPELQVRFPGERELHHPAPGGEYRLFPSFGLDLARVPDPVAVPTVNGELDHEALADRLDVDLAARPYPERVLWQAFAYTVFDPHADTTPHLAQLPSGHLVSGGQ